MDPPTSLTQTPLLPRYRRLLTFGDLLDESISLFRQHWVSFALVSAVALLPPGLILIFASATGGLGRSISLAQLQTGSLAQNTADVQAQGFAIAATSLLTALFDVLWSAAIVLTTDAYLRGEQTGLWPVYRRALPRLPFLILGALLYLIALLLLTGVATGLFIITGFGILGSIVATIGLLVWWLRPGARKTWLKILIILTTPFGLPMYVGMLWSMFFGGMVLERRGPINALVRSGQLVDRQWFRVTSILTVSSLIVAVLLSAPAALIDIPLTIGDAARGQFGLNPAEAAISNAASVVMQILFASVGSIVYALTFVDLRNRREATDIVERLNQLEATPAPADA